MFLLCELVRPNETMREMINFVEFTWPCHSAYPRSERDVSRNVTGRRVPFSKYIPCGVSGKIMAWVRHERCSQPNNLTELIYLNFTAEN